MHGRIAVAELTIDEATAAISGIGDVFAPEHIPIGVDHINHMIDRGDMNDWWRGRSIPASRQNIREAMKNLGMASTGKLVTKCFGLSLSDQYWINPADDPLEWDKVNFFENPFSEDVGNILFGGMASGRTIDLVSPDNTSDGWLKKKWVVIGGKRFLMKGGSDPFQQQPLNEAMASIVMERLDIPHVSYSVIWENGLPYSICENFITSKTELVSAFSIHNTKRIKDAGMLYDHYIDCCLDLGVPDAQSGVDKMLVADYLIVNSDRHLNNFGAVRNAETLEWVSPAPLFDNGSSFWYDQGAGGIGVSGNTKSQPFLPAHEEQIKLVKDFSWMDFGNIAGIEDEFSELLGTSVFVDKARRDALCFAMRERVKKLREIADNAQHTDF